MTPERDRYAVLAVGIPFPVGSYRTGAFRTLSLVGRLVRWANDEAARIPNGHFRPAEPEGDFLG